MSLHKVGPRSSRWGRAAGVAVVAAAGVALALPASAADVSAVIGDRVWNDVNMNGVQNAGEAGIANVTVTLNGTDIDGLPVSLSTTTNAIGSYRFDVPAGSYTVGFPAPAGWLRSPVGRGNISTDSAGESQQVSVTVGFINNTVDSGFFRPVTIGDRVWEDLNGNGQDDVGEPGIAGVTVQLTGSDLAGAPVDQVAVTAADGSYLFTALPGDYTAQILAPAGFQQTAGPSGPVSLSLYDGAADLTVDAGYVRPASLGDLVWQDTNGDGVRDAGEPGLAGVTVTVTGTDGAGQPVSSTVVTAADGSWDVQVPPGTYDVSFSDAPAGWTASPVGQDSVGTTATVTLVSGEVNSSVDSGFVPEIIVIPTTSTTPPTTTPPTTTEPTTTTTGPTTTPPTSTTEPTTDSTAPTTDSTAPTSGSGDPTSGTSTTALGTTAVLGTESSGRPSSVPAGSPKVSGSGSLASTGVSGALITAGAVGAGVLLLGVVLFLLGRRRGTRAG